MEYFKSNKCPHFLRKAYFNFLVWSFIHEYEDSIGNNLEIIEKALPIIELALTLKMDMRKAVGLKGDLYTPNLDTYISQLKMLNNTMTKTRSFFTWPGKLMRLPDLFHWFNINIGELNTHEDLLIETAKQFRQMVNLINEDREEWIDLGADNSLTFVASDTKILVKILDKVIY